MKSLLLEILIKGRATGPSAPALLSNDGAIITHSQLASAVFAASSDLHLKGVKPHDRLALLMAPGITMATSLLGASPFANKGETGRVPLRGVKPEARIP